MTVNHSENFVDPVSGATKNHVESEWQKYKMENKKRYGTQRTVIESYLGTYVDCSNSLKTHLFHHNFDCKLFFGVKNGLY